MTAAARPAARDVAHAPSRLMRGRREAASCAAVAVGTTHGRA